MWRQESPRTSKNGLLTVYSPWEESELGVDRFRAHLQVALDEAVELTTWMRKLYVQIDPTLGTDLGTAPLGQGRFAISPQAHRYRVLKTQRPYWMPVRKKIKALTYVVLHEMAHAQDGESWDDRGIRRPYQVIADLVPHGRKDYSEGYAEAYVEFYGSRGSTKNRAAHWYADRYGWEVT